MTKLSLRFGAAAILFNLASASNTTADDAPPHFLDSARTRALTPRETPPPWLDWNQIQAGMKFNQQHGRGIGRCYALLSLPESYAARDVIPILSASQLADDYSMRLQNTGRWFFQMTRGRPSLEAFLEENYRGSYELGQLHADLVEDVLPELNWDAEERVPFNQQSYGYTLLVFSFRPVEQLSKEGSVDFVRDRKGIEGLLHLWSVLGYGMGLDERLLPKDLKRAEVLMAQLRKRQLAAPREKPTDSVASLMSSLLKDNSERQQKRANLSAEQAQKATIDQVAALIGSSPGLSRALGLAPDTKQKLEALMARP